MFRPLELGKLCFGQFGDIIIVDLIVRRGRKPFQILALRLGHGRQRVGCVANLFLLHCAFFPTCRLFGLDDPNRLHKPSVLVVVDERLSYQKKRDATHYADGPQIAPSWQKAVANTQPTPDTQKSPTKMSGMYVLPRAFRPPTFQPRLITPLDMNPPSTGRVTPVM